MEFQPYAMVSGKKMRRGYTTGSCAAAAVKAAILALTGKNELNIVEIDTPRGWRISIPFEVLLPSIDGSAKCGVIKDGGDDPDATHGLQVCAEVELNDSGHINISTKEGIGIVTKPGLQVEVGQPAINPVPRSMIIKEASEVLPQGKGADILLSVPGGDIIAQKTFNPRLGIIGGISILGTTGIVEPMSEEAWKESLGLELSMLAAQGEKTVVLVPGNYGERFVAENFSIRDALIVRTSNFIGFMLDKCVEYKFENVLLVGHLGKIIKVAAGIFHTHSHVADARAEIVAAYAASLGASTDTVNALLSSNTTEEAVQIIDQENLQDVYPMIAERVAKRCMERSRDLLRIGAVVFSLEKGLLAMDQHAKSILSGCMDEQYLGCIGEQYPEDTTSQELMTHE